ncbi:hypothetical protein LCGC14_0581450 [marine sediment metagenome]|uniref:TonB-dependent siderophore receptor n=1 Tax=marine sediment metagenome TaxID=412755 RepID=A0A0F9U2G5_9ZZZZ|nr:TonB-dependent siderophore receptor [Methylophaga sp.]HEC60437.1 TonB-dependent siderophore receptor [Methylophaga sp.]
MANRYSLQRKPLSHLISIALMAVSTSSYAAENGAGVQLPSIVVEDSTLIQPQSSEETGEYKISESRASTKLNMSVKDTPQSISVMTRQQMDDFELVTLNDALNLTPAVNVEQSETDRTYYTSRGFSVTNFQVDGLAIPSSFDYPVVSGDVDTASYDRIEVLRGANGLMAGSGNPAATVNYIRKRPTTDFQASVKGTVGSWDRYRGEADVSGSLNEDGTVRGRFVAAYEDKNSYLDRYSKDREVFYGVLDFQLSDSTKLTVGHNYQMDNPNAVLWGSLPLAYSNGNSVDYKASASTSPDWTYWSNRTNDTFVELQSHFSNGWQTTAQASRVNTQSRSSLFYISGNPDVATGSGLFASTGEYDIDTTSYIADVYASGPFTLAGREHELVFGGQWAKSDSDYSGIAGPKSAVTLDQALSGSRAKPQFGEHVDQGAIDASQRSVYSSARLNFTDNLNFIIGTRFLDYEMADTTYGIDEKRAANEWIPYFGAVYSLTDSLNAYASYTEIFQPQSKADINNKLLDPADGQTYEIGLKMDLNDKRALASVSLFQTQQNNVAEIAGVTSSLQNYYSAEDGVTSNGIELDLSGEVAQGLQLMGGYTYVQVEDADGERTKRYLPKQSFKLASTYQLQSMPKLKIGTNVKWQTEIEDSATEVKQGAYAVWGAMASYQLSPKLKTTLNIDNILNKQYFNSFYGGYGQSYYAPTRSATVSMKYDF